MLRRTFLKLLAGLGLGAGVAAPALSKSVIDPHGVRYRIPTVVTVYGEPTCDWCHQVITTAENADKHLDGTCCSKQAWWVPCNEYKGDVSRVGEWPPGIVSRPEYRAEQTRINRRYRRLLDDL